MDNFIKSLNNEALNNLHNAVEEEIALRSEREAINRRLRQLFERASKSGICLISNETGEVIDLGDVYFN